MVTIYYITAFLIWFIIGILVIILNVMFLQNGGDYNPFKDHLSTITNIILWPMPLGYGIKNYLTKKLN